MDWVLGIALSFLLVGSSLFFPAAWWLFTQNAGILALLRLFPAVPSALGTTLGFITAAKLMLVNVSTALVILGLVIVLVLTVSDHRRGATR